MTATEDLLSRYNREASQEAFTELVARHLHLVQGAALRIGNGDLHFAKDVTQVVFMDLAVNSARVKPGVPLAGWLYRHACFTAMKALRANQRRVAREEKAMTLMHDSRQELSGEEVASKLDEAMLDLAEEDRMALVLRYFQRCDLREVGRALGVGEDAAQKRVSRAVKRLREILGRKGCAASGALLAAALGAGIPSSTALVASEVAGAALGMASAAKLGLGAAAAASVGNLAAGVAATTLAVSMAGALWWQGREMGRALQTAESLSQELRGATALRAENARLRAATPNRDEWERLQRENRDLHRLRAEVTELSRALAEAKAIAAASNQPAPTVTDSPDIPDESPAEPLVPTQVVIEVKLVEVRSDVAGSLRIPGIPGALGAHQQPIRAVLAAGVFQEALDTLLSTEGVDLLSAPKVLTLSGRQARVAVTQTQSVVRVDENGQEQMEPLDVGPVVDVTPYSSGPGGPIRLKIASNLTAFDGYRDGQPLIVNHTAEADMYLGRDGGLVLGMRNNVVGKAPNEAVTRHILTFISATEVDPAGNRVEPQP